MKKLFSALLPLVFALAILSACNPNPPAERIEYVKYDRSTIEFNDNHDLALSNYNDSLYYLNEWKLGYAAVGQTGDYFPDMADPIIIPDGGFYYAFGTRDTTVYQCFRSSDLTTWTRLADAFVPENGSWSRSGLYAPDIQQINGKWYLYYTATDRNFEGNRCQLGVAVSDNVYGPYKQFTGVNANGENITLATPAFNGMRGHQVLDANVLQDGGKLYMYFSYDTKTGTAGSKFMEMSKDKYAAEIWAVELLDPVTWDLDTITPLCSPGYERYDSPTRTIPWEVQSKVEGPGYGILEGPFVIKRDGKYILTYSANLYTHDCYAVGYAVSDNPMGPFVKPNGGYMSNMLLGVPGEQGTYIANRYKGFTKGTGHAGIFQLTSGEYMFAYHAHFNRLTWSETPPDNYRALALDYIYFDADGMPYTNGPTYSLQSKPACISGYSNIISHATVRAEGDRTEYLYDSYTNRAYKTAETARETDFKAGTRSIEIKFDAPVTVKAVNIFNSYDFNRYVDFIDQIDFGGGLGIVNAQFNQRYVKEDFIFPHAAFNIELSNEVVTDRIVITITSDRDFSLGEIEVVGKTD